jgi:heptosyltransferase-3
MTAFSALKPKKVLFIATRQIGDVLVTTPLISQARELWPDAEFHFLGYRGKLEMLKGNPDITHTIETSDRPKLTEYLTLFLKLFQRYDLAVVTQPSDRAYFYGLAAAHHRVGVLGGHPQCLTEQDKAKKSKSNRLKRLKKFHKNKLVSFSLFNNLTKKDKLIILLLR